MPASNTTDKLIVKFFESIEYADGCWLWTASLTDNGYARMYIGHGRYVKGHRWSYEHWRGPIPTGKESDHQCRNRRCVNPYCIELVTHIVNVNRGLVGQVATNQKISQARRRRVLDPTE